MCKFTVRTTVALVVSKLNTLSVCVYLVCEHVVDCICVAESRETGVECRTVAEHQKD